MLDSTSQSRAAVRLSLGWSTRVWTVVFGVALALFVAVVTLVLVYKQHERAIQDEKRELHNLATVLAEEADRSFQSLDLVQLSVLERIAALGITTSEQFRQRMAGEDVHQLLRQKIAGLPFITVLSVVDASGDLVNFSSYWPTPRFSLEDRDYFEALRYDSGTSVFLSKPVRSRATRDWAISRARKVEGPDGQFLGIVLAEVELAYFERFFQKISLGEASSVALFRRDGIMLARHPRIEESIGRSFAKQPLFRGLGSGERTTARQLSVVDGTEKFIAARALRHFPIVVSVTNTVEAVTAQWRRDAKYFVLLAGAGEILIAIGIFLALRHFRHLELLADARAKEAAGAAQLAAAEELRRQNVWFDAALNNMSQGLVMFGPDQKLIVANHRYAEVYGGAPDTLRPGTCFREMLEQNVRSRIVASDGPEAYVEARVAAATKGEPYDTIVDLCDGRSIAIAHRPLPNGGWVSTHEDITERRKAEAEIARLAKHDALTDVANRVLFRERLTEATALAARGKPAAVLCLDLDHFKKINDSLGHPIGDLLLKGVAERLRQCVRETDTVARLSGDEFAILQLATEQPHGASALARRILDTINAPYELDGHQVLVSTSVGIALSPNDCIDPDELLKSADLALYRAKADGRGRYRFFEREMDARMQARRALELDLRSALAENGFALHFQSIVSVRDGQPTGFEALLRWNHRTRGIVPPAEFVPLAEEIGLIAPIGAWVLREACTEAANWPSELKVAVNISPAQFNDQLVSTVSRALAYSGLLPSRLELEITESVLLEDHEVNLRILHDLRGLGVRISLDDFGTGYSSLGYLRKFPFDKIKIDQSFIRGLSGGSESAAIVRAVINLGHSLGMTTTAEGVETYAQLEQLRAEGCTEAQGYLFSHPCPASELPFLRGRQLAAVA